jgi:hypothetical protein
MSKKSSVSSNKSDGNGLGDGVAVGEDEVHSQADQIPPCIALVSDMKHYYRICFEKVLYSSIIPCKFKPLFFA